MGTILTLEAPLSRRQAREEAERCLQCFDPPCTRACPVEIAIPRFIRMLRSGNEAGAAEVVRAANPMAWSCGVACPDEQLCAAVCVRGSTDRPIEIRRLHRHATEAGEGRGLLAGPVPPAGGANAKRTSSRRPGRAGSARRERRVAVVGGGPAGLACAFALRRAGVAVTIFETHERVGGVLARTIPLYRFPEACLERDARWTLGAPGEVELRLRSTVLHPAALRGEFAAVFLAVGRGEEAARWEGANLRGVVGATAFLAACRARRYRNRVGREIAVLGGGNVAVDAALAAVRCGEISGEPPRVHLLYRRTRREMPAWEREVALAEQAGVLLHFLVQPERFVGRGRRLEGIKLSRTRLVVADSAGSRRSGGTPVRPRPQVVPGSRFLFPCDQAIVATGLSVDPTLLDLPRARDGSLRLRGRSQALGGGLFAGGDAAGGEQNIVCAARDGRRAAREILAFLEGAAP